MPFFSMSPINSDWVKYPGGDVWHFLHFRELTVNRMLVLILWGVGFFSPGRRDGGVKEGCESVEARSEGVGMR